jgi:hypothetical protein
MPFSRCLRSLLRASSFSVLLLALPALAQVTGAPTSSSSDVETAQVVKKPSGAGRNVAVGVLLQETGKTDGNFLRMDTTASGGGLVSYRQSPRWWFGYEASLGYTKFSDSYNKGQYLVEHGDTEVSASYLIEPPAVLGTRGFLSLGPGARIMHPSSYSGSLVTGGTPVTQTVPLFVLTIGFEHNIGEHFGFRVQQREDVYKAPDFKQVPLDTHKLRNSNEPSLSVYYRF